MPIKITTYTMRKRTKQEYNEQVRQEHLATDYRDFPGIKKMECKEVKSVVFEGTPMIQTEYGLVSRAEAMDKNIRTPEEIEQACREVRDSWSEAERRARQSRIDSVAWNVPKCNVSLGELSFSGTGGN